MGLDELIAARRTYGRVDEYDGEYVETEFTCLGWLPIPLIPGRSFWITHDRRSQRIGFPIKLHLRSVIATYLRLWAPGIAVVVLVRSSSSLATVVAATLFGLCAWSWTWWPRDAAARRGSDFALAAFGSRCDPAWMTDAMHEFLSHQLKLRAGADVDPRPPNDIVRFGARTPDEALLAYGLLRLAAARMPRPRGSRYHLDGADHVIGSAFRRLRSRGGPYRDRPGANALELWPTISAAAQARSRDRRAAMPSPGNAVPDSALFIPAFFRNPWIWLAALAVSTIFAGAALRFYVTPRQPPEQAFAQHSSPRQAPAASVVPPPEPSPSLEAPRRIDADELARRPLGEYVIVPCDYVQNSDRGSLRRVTLCGVGPRILAVAGGNRRRDNGQMLQGHIEAIPGGEYPAWASPLRYQLRQDPRYYDFYLKRDSHADDISGGIDDEDDRWNDSREYADRHHHRGQNPSRDYHTPETLLRAATVVSSLATLAGWFVWIRLWQLRRRAATWIVTG